MAKFPLYALFSYHGSKAIRDIRGLACQKAQRVAADSGMSWSSRGSGFKHRAHSFSWRHYTAVPWQPLNQPANRHQVRWIWGAVGMCVCVGVRALKRAPQIPILITYTATPDARAAGTRTHTLALIKLSITIETYINIYSTQKQIQSTPDKLSTYIINLIWLIMQPILWMFLELLHLINALICLMWVYMIKNVPICSYANIKSSLRCILCFLKKMSVVILNSTECFERIAVLLLRCS